ncbi:MAG: chemotaxis protein CheD [Hyphomicrobiales bacterium]|nr:MAG: chemotaxis protein CheD [Hyphomicrobiales bacterium]
MNTGNKRVVRQGEHVVSDDPDLVISTLLGSCVAACVHDPVAGVGGMNHFLLPGEDTSKYGESGRYGAFLMEALLNGVYAIGASRDRLQIKLFGGGSITNSSIDPGKLNIEFALRFARDEGLNVVSSSLGGTQGRRIEFNAVTGNVRQKFMTEVPVVEAAVKPIVKTTGAEPAVAAGELDFF